MQEKTNFPESFESTRHKSYPPDDFDPQKPRLGRRESEPHSDEINYIYDVLNTNFPDDRVMWDLHHYFSINEIDIDIQFDVSFFRDMQIPERLSSYQASKYDNRVPTMAVNVLSKSTWKTDIGENVDYCRKLNIPVYVVFPAYNVANKYYKPPFLRAYILQPDGEYHIEELREITFNGKNKNSDVVIDVSEHLPFRLGLQKRNLSHESNKALYRLILIHLDDFKVFLTKSEIEKKKAEEAGKKAEEAGKKAEEAEKKAEEAEKKAEEAGKKAEEAEKRAETLEEEVKELKEKLKKSSI